MAVRRKAAKSAARRGTRTSDRDAMMAQWMEASTPAGGHRRLDPLVGRFQAKTTFTMEPGAPPTVSEGTSENRWVLGGRYVEQIYRGSSMGMPFEGIGFTGYDNVQRKYVGTWMDSFGTGFMHSDGVGRPNARAMDFEAQSVAPSGRKVKFLCKIRIRDRDRHTYEMWSRGPGGKTSRVMLVEYTRA
jgi:hypothetical protein